MDGEVVKVFGSSNAPDVIDSDMVDRFFKYNSSIKEFICLEAKSFSPITDAVALKKEH